MSAHVQWGTHPLRSQTACCHNDIPQRSQFTLHQDREGHSHTLEGDIPRIGHQKVSTVNCPIAKKKKMKNQIDQFKFTILVMFGHSLHLIGQLGFSFFHNGDKQPEINCVSVFINYTLKSWVISFISPLDPPTEEEENTQVELDVNWDGMMRESSNVFMTSVPGNYIHYQVL